MSNQRTNERFTFQTRAIVKFKGMNPVECKSENLSLNGVLVDRIKDVMEGDFCKCQILIDGRSSNLVIKLEAEVVRITNDKMALNFLAVDDDTFYHLKNVVDYNTGNIE